MDESDEEKLKKQFEMQQELASQIAILERIAKSKMSKEAISRYGNLKLAHPDLAIKAIALIAQVISSGQLDFVDDGEFRELLKQIQEKKEFKFKK